MASYYIGVEPAGNPGESTTISVTEFTLDPTLLYKVRYLQRFPEGAPYPMIIETVNQIRAELRGGLVVLNSTFIGDPVRDMFKTGGISPVSIYVANVKAAIKPHIENAVDPLRRYDHLFWEVPFRDIISILQVVLQEGKLQISPELDLCQPLLDEILNFKLEISPSGQVEKLRVDQNADLLLSVAISVYTAARFGGNPIPIENLSSENTGVPDSIHDGHTLPQIWEDPQKDSQRVRLKYKFAQPQKNEISSNLPGLM